MAREITILQKLDHPNIVKLEGLATSRMQYSIYLVFDYMLTDLSRIISRPDDSLTEPQVKKNEKKVVPFFFLIEFFILRFNITKFIFLGLAGIGQVLHGTIVVRA